MGRVVDFVYANRKDFLSGLIVFLIALPLCLGIAQASHVPLFAGIVAGVIGGIVVGYLSGSHVSVSGPAAGLIAVTAVAIAELGSFELFLCAVVLAGVFQVVLGYIKAGSIANYIPSSVLEGMLAGIGLVIVVKQLPDAVGYAQNNAAVMVDAEDGFLLRTVNQAMHHIQEGALIITIVGLGFLFLWKKVSAKKVGLLPAGLMVVLVGTLLNELFINAIPGLALDSAHLVKLPIAASIPDFFRQFTFPDVSGFMSWKVWETGLVIAGVASIETLLCIEATDKLDPLNRYTPTDRELKAQGVGNILSGFLGGLPITSVIMRSSANINAGARSRRSSIFHGALLLICISTIPSLLNLIPKAAIAAILVYTGFKLCKVRVFRHMLSGGRSQFVPFLATIIGVVLFGLLRGVGIGLAISVFYTLRQNTRIPYYYKRSVYSQGEDLIKLTLAQDVSFINKASIKETLDYLPTGSNVIIDATNTEFIDFDILEILREFANAGAAQRGITISLTGFKDAYNLPAALTEREVLAKFINHEDVPERTAGSYLHLMAQLKNSIHPIITKSLL
jgi:MFS superfamily sulfate permease-like transporter